MISAVVAVDENWAIGKNDAEGKPQLLFNIPADLKHFKNLTKNKIVVMGYTTYLSLPKKPLPNRVNLVLWSEAKTSADLPGCITFNDFNNLLNFVQILSKEYDVVIMGGASVYKLFLPYYDVVHVTKVKSSDENACAFFPDLDNNGNFELEYTQSYWRNESTNGYAIAYNTYKRTK